MSKHRINDILRLNLDVDIKSNELGGFIPSKKFDPFRVNESIVAYMEVPSFDYMYLNIKSIPEYCFCNEHLPIDVYFEYFNKVKAISHSTIDDLLKIRHFNMSSSVSKKELTLYKKLVLNDETKHLSPSDYPTIGHFELWTKEESAPRVFFLYDTQRGIPIFYILVMDFKHTIHERKST